MSTDICTVCDEPGSGAIAMVPPFAHPEHHRFVCQEHMEEALAFLEYLDGPHCVVSGCHGEVVSSVLGHPPWREHHGDVCEEHLAFSIAFHDARVTAQESESPPAMLLMVDVAAGEITVFTPVQADAPYDIDNDHSEGDGMLIEELLDESTLAYVEKVKAKKP